MLYFSQFKYLGEILLDTVTKAQSTWVEFILSVGGAYRNGEDYRSLASDYIDQLYAFDNTENAVIFKPTFAKEPSFRTTKSTALDYFIGREDSNDQAFALQPWSSIVFDNQHTSIHAEISLVAGQYHFYHPSAAAVHADYTFGYINSSSGLKIVLQHSSVVVV